MEIILYRNPFSLHLIPDYEGIKPKPLKVSTSLRGYACGIIIILILGLCGVSGRLLLRYWLVFKLLFCCFYFDRTLENKLIQVMTFNEQNTFQQ